MTEAHTSDSREEQGNHDCLAKRRPGEPMFILLGRDPDAHNIVRSWAERRLAAGGDPEHCEMGLATAERMKVYAADPANAPASAPNASDYPAALAAHGGEGEAVAWLLTHPTEPTECEIARWSGGKPLTAADRAAGWTSEPLFTAPPEPVAWRPDRSREPLGRTLYEAFWKRNGGNEPAWCDQSSAIRTMWDAIADDALALTAPSPKGGE